MQRMFSLPFENVILQNSLMPRRGCTITTESRYITNSTFQVRYLTLFYLTPLSISLISLEV